jgi:hypothetical protein
MIQVLGSFLFTCATISPVERYADEGSNAMTENIHENTDSQPSSNQVLNENPKTQNNRRYMIDLPSRFDRWEPLAEVLATIILAFATLATAWSGYQSARWDGEQAKHYSQANILRVESTRASARANQFTQIDIGLFTNWVNAYAENNQQLADFYQKRFRAEFIPAFDAWVATQPLQNPDAPPSPFSMPEYRVADSELAQQLEQEASQEFISGEEANEIGDFYVLNTVFLASVLFLAGIASQVKNFLMKSMVVLLALFILAYGLYNVIIYPIN